MKPLIEMARNTAIAAFFVSTILGYMTYISLVAEINEARPQDKISLMWQYPFKPLVVYFQHYKLFPHDKVLRRGFLVLGAVQIASVLAFFTLLDFGFKP